MTVLDGRNWLEVLSPPDCWELLSSVRWARLGVMVDGHPEIFPINIAIHEQSIVFRADPGTKLRAAFTTSDVAIEADFADEESREGWSVLAIGPAHLVANADTIRSFESLDLEPWVAGPKAGWVQLKPTRVTGRRLRPDLRERGAGSPSEAGR